LEKEPPAIIRQEEKKKMVDKEKDKEPQLEPQSGPEGNIPGPGSNKPPEDEDAKAGEQPIVVDPAEAEEES
jgi:hypothetical protein